MVKSFQHERRQVEKLKNVRKTEKDGKRWNKRNGVLKLVDEDGGEEDGCRVGVRSSLRRYYLAVISTEELLGGEEEEKGGGELRGVSDRRPETLPLVMQILILDFR